MAGHGPSPGGHGAHPIHIHPARPFYRFAATGLGAAMWFFVGQYVPKVSLRGTNTGTAVLQSETRYASAAWLETPMGALRRDEELQREKLRSEAPEEGFGGYHTPRASIMAVQRFCNVNIGNIGVEAHANVNGPRSPYDNGCFTLLHSRSSLKV